MAMRMPLVGMTVLLKPSPAGEGQNGRLAGDASKSERGAIKGTVTAACPLPRE